MLNTPLCCIAHSAISKSDPSFFYLVDFFREFRGVLFSFRAPASIVQEIIKVVLRICDFSGIHDV